MQPDYCLALTLSLSPEERGQASSALGTVSLSSGERAWGAGGRFFLLTSSKFNRTLDSISAALVAGSEIVDE